MEFTLYICLGFMLIFGMMAVMMHSLLKSAIALAAASASLGVVMYTLGAVSAALFEISVCSGLVTVVFICAISLSNIGKEDLGKIYADRKRMGFLPIILLSVGGIMVVAALATGFSLPLSTMTAGIESSFKEIFWNQRQADIWGQMIVAVTGAFAIVILFKERV